MSKELGNLTTTIDRGRYWLSDRIYQLSRSPRENQLGQTGGERLFIKNTGLCKVVEHEVLSLRPARCRVGIGSAMRTRLSIEQLVNGGSNSNCPKVAKFLVE